MRRIGDLVRWAGLSWLAWRLLGPDLQPRFRGPQTRPLGLEGRVVQVGRNEWFVREAGNRDSPPLVLVHGWSFDGEMNFYGIIPALAEDFRVIVMDQRGHGKSDRIRGSFEVEDLADELSGVLDVLGVSGATVVGYSLGGMVAQTLALRHPAKVERLVLAATAARPVFIARPLVRLIFWLARAVARVSTKEMAYATFTLLRRSGILAPSYEAWMWENLRHRDPTLYYEAGHAAWRFDSRSWVGTLDVPVLVIVTTADQVVLPAAQRVLVEHLADPEVAELVGARHESILQRPDDYVKLITAFAKR
jgi:pimeloyl-ACP methyl ester carboxylesterase